MRFDVDAEHRVGRALLASCPGSSGSPCVAGRRGLHQPADLRRLRRQSGSAAAAGPGSAAARRGTPPRRRSRPDAAACAMRPARCARRRSSLQLGRAPASSSGPGQSRRPSAGTAHAVEADHRDRAAHRQHRPVAGDLRAAHLRGVDRAQQFEASAPGPAARARASSLVRSRSISARRAARAADAGHRRQRADAAHAVEQQRDARPPSCARVGLEPALERARAACARCGSAGAPGGRWRGWRSRAAPRASAAASSTAGAPSRGRAAAGGRSRAPMSASSSARLRRPAGRAAAGRAPARRARRRARCRARERCVHRHAAVVGRAGRGRTRQRRGCQAPARAAGRCRRSAAGAAAGRGAPGPRRARTPGRRSSLARSSARLHRWRLRPSRPAARPASTPAAQVVARRRASARARRPRRCVRGAGGRAARALRTACSQRSSAALPAGWRARHHQHQLLLALRGSNDPPRHRARALAEQLAQLEAAEAAGRFGGSGRHGRRQRWAPRDWNRRRGAACAEQRRDQRPDRRRGPAVHCGCSLRWHGPRPAKRAARSSFPPRIRLRRSVGGRPPCMSAPAAEYRVRPRGGAQLSSERPGDSCWGERPKPEGAPPKALRGVKFPPRSRYPATVGNRRTRAPCSGRRCRVEPRHDVGDGAALVAERCGPRPAASMKPMRCHSLDHRRARAVEVQVAADPRGRARSLVAPHLGAGEVDEVHALRHHQQVLRRGRAGAQLVQPLADVRAAPKYTEPSMRSSLSCGHSGSARAGASSIDDERPVGRRVVSKPIVRIAGREVRYR